jgi:hypothetical protein
LAKISTTSCVGGRDGDISLGRRLTRSPVVDSISLKVHDDLIRLPKSTKI